MEKKDKKYLGHIGNWFILLLHAGMQLHTEPGFFIRDANDTEIYDKLKLLK